MFQLLYFILLFISNSFIFAASINTISLKNDTRLEGMGSAVNDDAKHKILDPKDQRLTISINKSTASLKDMNYLYQTSTAPNLFLINTFEGLLSLEMEGSAYTNNLRPKYGCAESCVYNEDTCTWTIKLKKNLKWSDGSKLTAHDFVRTLRAKLDPNSYPNKIIPPSAKSTFIRNPVYKNTKKILDGELPIEELGVWAEGDDCLKLQYESKHVLNSSLYNLIKLYPLHPDYIKEIFSHKNDEDFTKVCGNGPFMLADFKEGSYFLLKKNPHYWDADNVILNEVKAVTLEEDNSIQEWRAGTIDLDGLDDDDLVRLTNKDIQYVASYPKSTFRAFFINCDNPKLKNARVRRALNILLDRDTLISSLMAAPKGKLYGFLDGHIEDVGLVIPFWAGLDLESKKRVAKSLLWEAGYGGNNKLRLDLNIMSEGPLTDRALALLNQIPDCLEVRLAKKEAKAFFSDMDKGNYEILFCGASVRSPEFYHKFYPYLYSNSSKKIENDCRFSHERFNQILENMPSLNDRESLRELEKILQEESPMIPIFLANLYYLVGPAVGNWAKTKNIYESAGAVYFKHLYRKSY